MTKCPIVILLSYIYRRLVVGAGHLHSCNRRAGDAQVSNLNVGPTTRFLLQAFINSLLARFALIFVAGRIPG